MHTAWTSMACFAALCVAVTLPACSDSSEPPPSGQSGSSGSAAGGTSPLAGAPQGGTGVGGTSVGGSAAGGNGGTALNGGSATGGTPTAGTGGAAGGSAGEGGAGGQPPNGEVVAECLDAPVLAGTRTEALSFEGDGLRLGIVRYSEPDSLGTSGTTPWLAQRFALERGAVARCSAEASELQYVGSHHNFYDTMSASVDAEGETWVFRQTREGYDKPTHWTVEARTLTGSAIKWGPVTLTLVSCQRLDTDASCADSYD